MFIVALDISLDDHDPPDAGRKLVVPPIHMPEGPDRDIDGLGFTMTGVVGNEGQPPVELVNVKVACPWEIPMTIPLLFTEATAGLLLTQTPPEYGDSVVLLPTHIGFGPVTDTTPEGKTVIITEESDLQPDNVFVYTNRAVPLVMPVTSPLSVSYTHLQKTKKKG